MIKRVADARMGLNWDAAAVKEAESASAQTRKESTRFNLNVLFQCHFSVPYGICRMCSISRMRISELERELEEITKKAIMTSTHASKTASALAKVS